ADSLLLDGFTRLLVEGDGLAARDRFKRATEQAPSYPQAWYVLGEFYYHFAGLFDETVGEAGVAFNRVLDLDPRFSPAIGHLISLAHQAGDRRETADLIHRYLRIDSTSVVAEAVGIADTLILGSAPAQLALLRTVCRHSLLALQYLAFQAAEFGTPVQRTGPARVVLRCLEQRGATDAERARILRMGVAADLAAGWADSARLRLARATGGSAARERDQWILLARATGLPALGDWQSAAERVRGRLGVAADTEAVAHWLLARLGIERSRHAAALARLAAGKRGPLPASLATDLDARAAMIRGPHPRRSAIARTIADHLAVNQHDVGRQILGEDEVDPLVERGPRVQEIGPLAARQAGRLAVRLDPGVLISVRAHQSVGRGDARRVRTEGVGVEVAHENRGPRVAPEQREQLLGLRELDVPDFLAREMRRDESVRPPPDRRLDRAPSLIDA